MLGFVGAAIFHEVKAHATEPGVGKALEFGIRNREFYQRDPQIAALGGLDGILDDAVVIAVHQALNDDATLDAGLFMQCKQGFLGRIGRDQFAVGRKGEYGARPKDMHMGVAGTRRQLDGARRRVAHESQRWLGHDGVSKSVVNLMLRFYRILARGLA